MRSLITAAITLCLAACGQGGPDFSNDIGISAPAVAQPVRCPSGSMRKGNRCIPVTPAPSPSPAPTPAPAPAPAPQPTPTPAPAPAPAPAPDPSPAPMPMPAPAPAPSGWVPSPSLHGLPDIESNFDKTGLIFPTIVPAVVPGDPGAFRFLCEPGQVLADDPIVYPGQPGKSHLHQFYGNTAADANSTYESLRTSGDSTCLNPLNRSGYWLPAMLDGLGNVVQPDYAAIYYKRRPASDPKCTPGSGDPQFEGICTPLPNGLRFISGWNAADPDGSRTGSAYFNCQGPTAVPGTYPDLPTAMAHCPVNPAGTKPNLLGAIIAFPDCWDGKNLDSADHRSHVAYSQYGDWGYLKCDAAHPYLIPTFTLQAWYSIMPGDDPSKWSFSSDAMAPGKPAGYTFHADWWGAWDPETITTWTEHCINEDRSCAGGQLGDGTLMGWVHQNFGPRPRLPISSIPQTPVQP